MGQTVIFDYYYGMQAEQYSFFRIPKLLFTDACFKGLSCEAKLLYGLLLDRMSLSVKNRWFDDANRVYIVYTIEEVIENMSCSKQKAIKIMAELDGKNGIGLIEKKRLGLGRANIIYVKNFVLQNREDEGQKEPANGENSQKYENHTSRGMKMEPQEVSESNFKRYENQTSRSIENGLQEVAKLDFKKYDIDTSASMEIKLQEVPESYPINTDLNNTDFSNTESNHIVSEIVTTEKKDAIDAYREIVHDNIEYDILCQQYPKEDIDEIVELILEIVSSKRKTIRISGEDIGANMVKGRFMKLTYTHLQYVFESLSKNTTKVTNIKQYLLAVLYNAPVTMNHYYKAEVQHDLYGG